MYKDKFKSIHGVIKYTKTDQGIILDNVWKWYNTMSMEEKRDVEFKEFWKWWLSETSVEMENGFKILF